MQKEAHFPIATQNSAMIGEQLRPGHTERVAVLHCFCYSTKQGEKRICCGHKNLPAQTNGVAAPRTQTRSVWPCLTFRPRDWKRSGSFESPRRRRCRGWQTPAQPDTSRGASTPAPRPCFISNPTRPTKKTTIALLSNRFPFPHKMCEIMNQKWTSLDFMTIWFDVLHDTSTSLVIR